MRWNPLDVAWLAGLYEGEGSVYTSKRGYLVVRIAMTDREPVERAYRIAGGTFEGARPRSNPRYKPIYSWGIFTWEAGIEFFDQIGPFLSPRRLQQMADALSRRPAPIRRPTSAPCGRSGEADSYAGVHWHKRRGEPPCENCRKAASGYKRQRRAMGKI